MAMKRCHNGHFFDGSKYSNCPYCTSSGGNMQKTVAMRSSFNMAPAPSQTMNTVSMQKTVAMKSEPEMPVQDRQAYNGGSDVKTVGVMRANRGIEPVVGWLVCAKGPYKGMDYRIKAEKNFIGREANMDISLSDDVRVSRENHAVVSYDPEENRFMLIPGDSHGLTYLNGSAIYSPVELIPKDIIKLGQTELVFVPFCGSGGFVW